jgi:hypothetical protein
MTMFNERIKQIFEGTRNAIINDPDQANAIYRARVDLVEGVR